GQSKIKVENQETYDTAQGSSVGLVNAGTEVSESKDTIGNLGLGAMYRINDALSLRGEGRAIHNFDNNWWEGMALAGLEVVLGGHLAPTVAVPPMEEPNVVTPPIVVVESDLDSDGDGVPDSIDACPGTPMNVVVDERGCPVPVDITDELKMELRVFFDNDKSAIKNQYKPEIAKVAEKMREYPNSTARVEGHASKTGPSARYNQRLSEARAVAVKSMLTNEFGIAPNRLSTVGYGYDQPIADNNTEEGRAMNRRVYAIITGDKTMTVEQTKDMVVQ
ncbi:OmpA family protein, partial [uncultured Psychrobacter sp.]|uniref:OmpA family protein n=1 Tax=uncultured Psychrobacter sp. TaxID=259303 RepID=UPI0026103CE8